MTVQQDAWNASVMVQSMCKIRPGPPPGGHRYTPTMSGHATVVNSGRPSAVPWVQYGVKIAECGSSGCSCATTDQS